MIPTPDWVGADPVACSFRTLFAPVDWTSVAERSPETPGPLPHPPVAYLKALLVKIDRRLASIPALHQYLQAHPALVWELGFHRGMAPDDPADFPVDLLLPTERWFRAQQQRLAPQVARLLADTVQTLAATVPQLAANTALDATHHLAWVKQNNFNQSVVQRFSAATQPSGDPDCRLGGKTRHPAPGVRTTEAFWGYHSAILAAVTPGGMAVLGATVAPVVGQEVQLVRALMPQGRGQLRPSAPRAHRRCGLRRQLGLGLGGRGRRNRRHCPQPPKRHSGPLGRGASTLCRTARHASHHAQRDWWGADPAL
jgi:hypothetical protein